MSAEQVRKQQPLQQPERKKQVKVKVHKQKWISTGEKFLYSITTAAVIATSVFLVHFSASTDGLNRDIQHLEEKIDAQQSQNENLAYQVKELSNPDRILKIAKENGLSIKNSVVKQAGKVTN